MKKIFFPSIAIFFLVFGCARSNGKTDIPNDTSFRLSLSEAEKIMGEPLRLNDSSSGYSGGVYFYKSSYFSNTTDTNKIGRFYYMYEEYDREADAHNVYQGFKIANEKNSPLTDLSFGDEGYYQGPPGPPPFILVRKGNKMLRLKINRSTSNTSLDEFMTVSKKIVVSL